MNSRRGHPTRRRVTVIRYERARRRRFQLRTFRQGFLTAVLLGACTTGGILGAMALARLASIGGTP